MKKKSSINENIINITISDPINRKQDSALESRSTRKSINLSDAKTFKTCLSSIQSTSNAKIFTSHKFKLLDNLHN